MKVGFNNIYQQIIPLEQFRLKWRFLEAHYGQLPPIHLQQLGPLNQEAAHFVWDFIDHSGLHDDTPFKKNFFKTIDRAKITINNQKEIKKWLYQKGIPFKKDVFLSWQPDTAMIVPWKFFIKYFDTFYYSTSDDLSIIDQSLEWALLCYHEDELYFGTNKKYVPNTSFDDIDFIW